MFGFIFRLQQSRTHHIGVRVSDTMAETMTAMLKVMANSRNSRPTIPVMNINGMKTATSEKLREMTVKPDLLGSFERRLASASRQLRYSARYSRSSRLHHPPRTRSRSSAINDRLSKLNPMSFITPKVPMTASGNATLGITVGPQFAQEHKDDHNDQATVNSRVNCTSRTEARMVAVRSLKIATFTEGGMEARSLGSKAFTRSAVSIMLGARLALDVEDDRRADSPTHPPSRTFSPLFNHLPHSREAHRRAVAISHNDVAEGPRPKRSWSLTPME
jgi:hypothetical protein